MSFTNFFRLSDACHWWIYNVTQSQKQASDPFWCNPQNQPETPQWLIVIWQKYCEALTRASVRFAKPNADRWSVLVKSCVCPVLNPETCGREHEAVRSSLRLWLTDHVHSGPRCFVRLPPGAGQAESLCTIVDNVWRRHYLVDQQGSLVAEFMSVSRP